MAIVLTILYLFPLKLIRNFPMNKQRAMFASLLIAVLLTLGADQAQTVKPSDYAPAKDLATQVDELIGKIESDLEDKEEFGKDQKERIGLNANALASVALVLGKHDQENEYQKAAPELIKAASKLSSALGDFDKATAALAVVKASLKTNGDASKLEWEVVGDTASLMRQVPIVNNSLRRGVTSRRFARSIDKTAGLAAQLAAIAHTTSFDTEYCEDEAQEEIWRKASFMMRDGSAEVIAALHKEDQEAAKSALKKVVMSCDACHKTFRSE
jgi:hypothetical protein